MNVLLIAGSRIEKPKDKSERRELLRSIHHILNNASYTFDVTFEQIVHGDARGIDRIGGAWAEHKGYPVIKHPADWKTYGKRAGYVRNKEMVDFCTHGIVLWDGKSPGSQHTIDLLVESGKPTVIATIGHLL